MSGFLHGVESVQLRQGPQPVTEVASAITAIVGTAPMGPLNELTLVLNPNMQAQFGAPLPGFTLPKAFEGINANGGGTLLVVNVYDPTKHNVTETGETQSIDNGRAKLDFAPMANLVIENQATETLVEGEHYTVDAFGNVQLTPAAINGVPETLATGSIDITGGTVDAGVNTVATITVDGVDILGAAVDFVTDNDATAAAVAAQITSNTSSPNYTATSDGATVIVTAVAGSGATPNGFVVAGTVTGDVTLGNAVAMSGGVTLLTATTSIVADYDRFNPSLVSIPDVIGTTDPNTGAKNGMQLWDLAVSLFSIRPRLLIAPFFSSLTPITNELKVKANKFRGHAFADAPIGTTFQQALQGRGPSGSINFFTSDKRMILCYPHVKAFDTATEADELRPLSIYACGVTIRTDRTAPASYAKSPSNEEIRGITGLEFAIEGDFTEQGTPLQALNEAGIVTVMSAPGAGRRLYGNRSAAWPSDAFPTNFINVQRVADVLQISLEQASLPFVDQPLNRALIDNIIATVSSFMATLFAQGRLVDPGKVFYDPALNPPTELALGRLTITYEFMPPPPAERITYRATVDINQLNF